MKSKLKMLITILLSAGLLASSCHKDTTPSDTKPPVNPVNPPHATPTASEYFPNSVGDSWEYYVYDSSQFNGIPEYTVTVKITNIQKLVDGKDAAVWQYQYPWGIDTNYVRLTGDTVKIFSLAYSSTIGYLQFPGRKFLLPFKDGQQWYGDLYGVSTYNVTAMPIVKTNFYEFDSSFRIYNQYAGPNIEYEDEFWFRPNIGMVQIHYHEYNLGPIYRVLWQLKKYSLQ